MDLTIVQQGSFVSTGEGQIVELTSGVDWMKVYNWTQANTSQTTALAVEFYWQRGFPANSQWAYFKSNAVNASNLIYAAAGGGFTLIDTSLQAPGALVSTITAISNASIPVATNTGVNGLSAGSIVRLINVAGATQFGGIEFTVGLNTLNNTHFSLDFAPQIVAATTGSWRVISNNPYWQPSNFVIASISQAAQAVIIPTVTQFFTVGQSVRINVPAAMGMVEMNGLLGNIVAVNSVTNAITVDIDSSAFTAFAWPLTGGAAFTPATLVPVGEDTSLALANSQNILADSTVNTSLQGMFLTGGAGYPAGATSDLIYWVAGKSFANSEFGE